MLSVSADRTVAGLPASLEVYGVPFLVFGTSHGDSNCYVTDHVELPERKVKAILSAMRRNFGWEFMLEEDESDDLSDYIFLGSLSWKLDDAGDAVIKIREVSKKGTPVMFGEL